MNAQKFQLYYDKAVVLAIPVFLYSDCCNYLSNGRDLNVYVVLLDHLLSISEPMGRGLV